jgi:hypothetical protein
MITAIETVEEVLRAHAAALGTDFTAYRNHVYRVANLCLAFAPGGSDLEKVAIAAVYHDLGIWTAGTFDYLAPSVALAEAHLAATGRADWTAEITAMILGHHQVSRYRGDPALTLVEPFRRADWVDVSRGLITFGLPGEVIRQFTAAWPSAGFHLRLVQLSFARLRTHPWSPLPMLRL